MAEPKYYANDKAILEEMIRLEKAKRDAQAEGILGAGTIALDAVGLKALGTMGRLATKADDIPLVRQPVNTEQAEFQNAIGEIEKRIYNPERYKFDEHYFEIPKVGDPLYPHTRFTPSPKKIEESEKIYGQLEELSNRAYRSDFKPHGEFDPLREMINSDIQSIANRVSKDPELNILVKKQFQKSLRNPDGKKAFESREFYDHFDQLVGDEISKVNMPIHPIEHRIRNKPYPDDYDIEDLGSIDNYEYSSRLSGGLPPASDPTFNKQAEELLLNKFFIKPKQYDFVTHPEKLKRLNYDLARDTSLRAKQYKKDIQMARNKSQRDTTDKLLAEQRKLGQEAFKQQQRGYNELAAATIPFVGGIDMMYDSYQNYVNAQNQLEKMMKQASPKQKVEFEKKLKEERMKQYQLKDSDFRFK